MPENEPSTVDMVCVMVSVAVLTTETVSTE